MQLPLTLPLCAPLFEMDHPPKSRRPVFEMDVKTFLQQRRLSEPKVSPPRLTRKFGATVHAETLPTLTRDPYWETQVRLAVTAKLREKKRRK